MINNFYLEALYTIHPNTQYTEGSGAGKTIAKDIDNNVIELDESKIDAEVIRLQASYDAQAYSRKREAEYPSVQECVHAILDDELTALQEKRQAVKTKYPKS